MILFHVSTNLYHDGKFTPRIPKDRLENENDSLPRICACSTIDDCFSAMPEGSSNLEVKNAKRRGYYLVFRIDTEKLGIPNDKIIGNEALYEDGKVTDADITKEHWITKSFVVPQEDTFMIHLIAWEEATEDIIPLSLYKQAKEQYNNDIYKAYSDIYGGPCPSTMSIHDIIYTHESIFAGEEVSLYPESEEERRSVASYIKLNFNVHEYKSPHYGEISFSLSEDSNIRQLFLFHYNLAKELDSAKAS